MKTINYWHFPLAWQFLHHFCEAVGINLFIYLDDQNRKGVFVFPGQDSLVEEERSCYPYV